MDHDFAYKASSSNRNGGEKVLSCVLLHVIRLSRVEQLIVSRRVAGIRVGLLALLAYHFDVVVSIPRYLVIKIFPVLILKPAIPSKLQHRRNTMYSNLLVWGGMTQNRKKKKTVFRESFVYLPDVFFQDLSSFRCRRLKIS